MSRLTLICLAILFAAQAAAAEKQFRAGAFAIDITPLELPVIVNGGMTERVVDKVEDRLHARCLVLDDGTEQIAIVIVDSCMMPRTLLDDAKKLASDATKIKPQNMLIAATHAHSAPSVFGCLGSDADEKYSKFLPVQIAKGIQQAHANLQPARIGWAVGRDEKNVASRRWLMKPGVAPTNAYGGKANDRVMMHPGPANKNAIAATGIIDSDVPVISVQTKEGKPLAVLTNYSMHYVGAPNLSADYFAVVCEKMAEHLKEVDPASKFVAMHSNGTSGDQWLMDYTKPRREFDRFGVGQDVANAAFEAYQRVIYYDWVPLVMAEKLLEVGIRQPDKEELAEAQKLCDTFKDRKPKTVPEVYAREAVLLSQMPAKREIKLQALRIGELGIAAIPNEVFSSTGLQIKIESPTPTTFTIELANGAEGYIPPPKQHKLGGYETWRARSSCLEVNAEPKIRAAALELLNKVNDTRAEEVGVLTDPPKTSAFTPKALHLLAQGRAAHPGLASAESSQPQRGWTGPSQSSGTPSGFDARVPNTTQGAPKTAPLGYEVRPLRGEEYFTATESRGALPPDEELKTFKLRPGLKIELVAAEPLVVDPVAFDWGFDGKLWVVEMHDYPNGLGAAGPDAKGPPGGRVKVLEDTDDDGKYDKATIFADQLSFPNGILVMPDGNVLVTAAPAILRLKDTNKDGKADEQEVLFSGFAEGNQQLRVNGLRWGLDGWIYCANGGVGRGDPKARVKVERTGELVDLGGRDFRFSLDYKKLVPELGMSQFGRNRDDFGNWFGCNNNTPLYHIVHDDALLRRNPNLVPEATTVFVPQLPKPGPVYAISEKGIFYHPSEVGRFTSANSAMIYRDRFLGDDFSGNFFVSEPVHNLVHREIVTRHGATFTSHRPADEQDKEFLASTDTWFRPNTIRTGPDGALYISDMYREIIEHPAWIQPEKKAGLSFRRGDDCGRIWRIVPEGKEPRKWKKFEKQTLDELVKSLEDPSGELRDMAHRWIMVNFRGRLIGTGFTARGKQAESRLTMISLLDAKLSLPDPVLIERLGDVDPRVRAYCVRLAAARVANSPEIGIALLARLTDPDDAVKLQLAYALGEWPDLRAADGLAQLLSQSYGKPFLRDAALSSLSAENIEAVAAALKKPGGSSYYRVALMAAKFRRPQFAEDALRRNLSDPLGRSGDSIRQLASLVEYLQKSQLSFVELIAGVQDSELKAELQTVMDEARQVVDQAAESPDKIDEQRVRDSSLLLAHIGDVDADLKRLACLLNPKFSTAVQSSAVQRVIESGRPAVPELLLANWKSYLPAIRSTILDGLLSRELWTNALLAKIESGEIAPADLDAVRQQRLLAHPNPKVKERAAKLLASAGSADRKMVVAEWSKVLELKGDPMRGKEIFTKRCATCHKWQGEGNSVGPDLNTLTDRSPRTLLTAILDPNLAVEPKYQSYSVTTDDGRVLSGMLAEETGNSLTLADAEGKKIQVARKDIVELKSTGKSLMPEGIEKDLTMESLADVLSLIGK
jgi:putative membrane-bound dehydrogenase-like protein